MQRVANPEMDRLILDHLVDLYKLKSKREGIHLSTLVYCLTRGFFDQVAPVEPTDEEVMLFSLGLGLQDVLTPKGAEAPVYIKDGITFSPDMAFLIRSDTGADGKYVELKTTRMSLSRSMESLPETWVEYIMGGCYIRDINSYELVGLYMLGNYKPPFPIIYSETLVFTDEELESNWNRLLDRKAIYVEALENNKPPVPSLFCKGWECKNCRYKLQCDAMKMLAEQEAEPELNARRPEDWDT